MIILVTGATGLCGRAIINHLVKKGITCVGYSRSKPSNPVNGCIYEQGDLASLSSIMQVMQKHGVTHIIHSGGISHPLISADEHWNIIQTNIVGTVNILDAARILKVKRVVYLSSGAVYGNSKADHMCETDACFPTTTYGVTKLASEGLCRVYKERYGLETVSLRLCYIYGPGRYQPDAMRDILNSAIKRQNVIWKEGGGQELEYLHVDDCARAVILALEAENLPYNEVNIGSGINTSIIQIGNIVSQIYPECRIEIKGGALGYDLLGPFDCTRARNWLGFAPQVALEDGIATYAEWLEKNKK
jgi:nucleoside-diphosphate-sugar epimerase